MFECEEMILELSGQDIQNRIPNIFFRFEGLKVCLIPCLASFEIHYFESPLWVHIIASVEFDDLNRCSNSDLVKDILAFIPFGKRIDG